MPSLHGRSCKSRCGRVSRHQMLNNIIHRSLASANISSRLEPSGLYRADGNRPDGVTLIPWSKGKFLVWDATCVDTFCDSNTDIYRPEKQVELLGMPRKRNLKSMSTLTNATIFKPSPLKPVVHLVQRLHASFEILEGN